MSKRRVGAHYFWRCTTETCPLKGKRQGVPVKLHSLEPTSKTKKLCEQCTAQLFLSRCRCRVCAGLPMGPQERYERALVLAVFRYGSVDAMLPDDRKVLEELRAAAHAEDAPA